MILFWIFIFSLSLFLLIKGSDWFLESAEKIGLILKISPFIIGITIVAIGTSLPELASSISAVLKDKTEVAIANVVGSNIANILLIVGLAAVAARTLVIERSLIDLDAPLLATSTVLFTFVLIDKKVVFWESFLLLFAFFVYFLYTLSQRKEEAMTSELTEILPKETQREVLPSRVERRKKELKEFLPQKSPFSLLFFLILGLVSLIVGANYTIDSLVYLSQALKIPPSLIAILALAVGTSLPELMVSVKAAVQKKHEIALGNIFGSNVFNALFIIGVSGCIKTLFLDNLTFLIGIPFLVASTFLFVISGISRRIHSWEGMMYLLLYFLFVAKLLNLF